jgi:hypothetical protein
MAHPDGLGHFPPKFQPDFHRISGIFFGGQKFCYEQATGILLNQLW